MIDDNFGLSVGESTEEKGEDLSVDLGTSCIFRKHRHSILSKNALLTLVRKMVTLYSVVTMVRIIHRLQAMMAAIVVAQK